MSYKGHRNAEARRGAPHRYRELHVAANARDAEPESGTRRVAARAEEGSRIVSIEDLFQLRGLRVVPGANGRNSV